MKRYFVFDEGTENKSRDVEGRNRGKILKREKAEREGERNGV